MIVVVGSLNMDLVVGLERHPLPGETVLGGDYATHPGGKGANQALAAARASGGRVPVRMVGRVGSDAFGPALRDGLAADGVDVGPVGSVSGPSGVAFIAVDRAGRNSIIVSSGANWRLSPGDLGPAAFVGARVVVLQLEVPPETVREAARLGREAGALVMLNAAPARSLSKADLEGVDLLVVNEFEAGIIMAGTAPEDVASATAVAESLQALGPDVVVTLGERGAVWRRGGASGHRPAFPVTAVDTTAAGDAFVGGLAVGLAEGMGWEEALGFASAAGALTATRRGAQPSLPGREEVEALVAGDEPGSGRAGLVP